MFLELNRKSKIKKRNPKIVITFNYSFEIDIISMLDKKVAKERGFIVRWVGCSYAYIQGDCVYLFARRSDVEQTSIVTKSLDDCTRDSIYFVYSAEKCFHLRGNCQSDSRRGSIYADGGRKICVRVGGKKNWKGRKRDRG